MPNTILADSVVLLHFLFILFVIFGSIFSFFNIKWSLLHVPALVWAICIELFGWVCPLTPLENKLRSAAPGTGYDSGFIDHYLVPIIYPTGLNRETQIILGMLLLLFNLIAYTVIVAQNRKNIKKNTFSMK